MHRSYHPTTPASSKLLQKRWDDHHYNKHRISVNSVKPEIDSSPPVTFMHLHLKLKKLQLEEERLATIERDNRILLEKMSQIVRTRGRIDNVNNVQYKSLSRDRRKRELMRISKENVRMMQRIGGKKSSLSNEQMEREWRRNLRYMDNISAFPEEWYLQKDTGRRIATARSNPNMNSTRRSTEKDKSSDEEPAPAQEASQETTKKTSVSSKKEKKMSVKKNEATKDDEKKYEDDFEEN